MLRFAMLCLPMLLFSGSLEPRPERVASRTDDAAAQVSGAVRARFALAASAADCRIPDNRYSYNLLLAQAGNARRPALRAAADEGRREGEAMLAKGVDAPCAAKLEQLTAADDALVVFAERYDAGVAPGR